MSRNADNFQKKHKMKKLLRNLLLFPTLSTSAFCVYAPIILAVPSFLSFLAGFNNTCLANEEIFGKLEIKTYVNNPDFTRRKHNTVHRRGASEGLDGFDRGYYNMYNLETVIISHIPDCEYDINVDSRSIDSLTPVDLELSLVSNSGSDITLNSENELWCSLPLANTPPYFADFGNKPITLWEKSIIDPNENPNDPNNYTISFIADIREAIDKSDFYTSSGKTAKIPRPDFDGTYKSGVPYMYAQERFNTFPGDFNFDGKVDLDDFAYFAQDWNATDVNSVADITGPNGLPDKNVNAYDLSLFTRDYLKDANDPNTWSRVR